MNTRHTVFRKSNVMDLATCLRTSTLRTNNAQKVKEKPLEPLILSPINHLWEICVKINSYLRPKDLFKIMLTCSQYYEWVVKYNLEKHVPIGVSSCLAVYFKFSADRFRKYEKSLLFMMDRFGHVISESQLLQILQQSCTSGLDRLMYSAIDLMDSIRFESILELYFRDQNLFDMFFRHPKLIERVEEFQDSFIAHLESTDREFRMVYKFFFNSELFNCLIENSLPWIEKNSQVLREIKDLDVKMRQIPKLKQLVIKHFESVTDCNTEQLSKIVLQLSKKERETVESKLNDEDDLNMEHMKSYEVCKVFGKSILEKANSQDKKSHNLIALCLRTNPELAKDFDLRTFGYDLIVNRQFAIISGLVSTFSLKFIEQLAPSPRSFLVMVLRSANPLGSNSNYIGLRSTETSSRITRHKVELIYLIENMFHKFPDMKIRRFNDKVLREAKNLHSKEIEASILKHKDYSTECDSESDCSSSEDEYSLESGKKIMDEINKKRIERNQKNRKVRRSYRNYFDEDDYDSMYGYY
ncbi:hypothetical protein NAEGRDRAFT_77834 [Naegleria gruberi]|uniref:Uncharacterized protein n=1 Tax=Naegleria gruberi TaxID=5762 RepID=D2UX31_NAEGR|nr:uncharacterized protein NAEGRDRAFT_77834 [Naegleria gruberi]EFC50553.1 hypothetical protein NAEGRDRAFT_77834 [Naegleria gruberi]|eukprot:XP_002683297.1 hypothetical protein NAEGRDRAFT_77834 [Naegleria gruberi strain NEG-M]